MSETTIPNLYLPPEIMTDDRLTLRQIRVLMAIFSWRKANTNLARISRQMISDRTGYPLSRVSTITTELEKLGWIKKTGNGGKSQWTEYRVKELKNFKKTKASNGNQNSNGYQNGNGNQNSNETVTNSVTQTVTNSVRGIDTGVNTAKEQVKKKVPKKNYLSLADEFDESLKHSVVQIIEHRKEMGAPVKTKRAIEMLIKKIKHYANHWEITNSEAFEFWLGERWQSIDIDYKYPFRKGDKEVSKYEMTESRKIQSIATFYEKQGIDPWDENGNIRQDLIDDFNKPKTGVKNAGQKAMRLVG
jgi:hypothetical protein